MLVKSADPVNDIHVDDAVEDTAWYHDADDDGEEVFHYESAEGNDY